MPETTIPAQSLQAEPSSAGDIISTVSSVMAVPDRPCHRSVSSDCLHESGKFQHRVISLALSCLPDESNAGVTRIDTDSSGMGQRIRAMYLQMSLVFHRQ